MKVAIINTNDISGGAARAAYSLYSNLSQLGLDVNYFVKDKKISDNNIIKIKNDSTISSLASSKLIEDKINLYRTTLSNTLFQIPYTKLKKFPIDLFHKFDVINLHWVAFFLSPEIIYTIGREKHLVWTLHDQAPLTGGCHYTSGCEGFKFNCSNCLQANFPNGKKLPELYFEDKFNFLSNLPITFVVASRWMEECVKNSRLFSSHRVEYIPYSIDTTFTFKQKDKSLSKERLGIPNKKVTILFGADNGNEIRKGFHYLIEAIKILTKIDIVINLMVESQIQLVFLGKMNKEISDIGIPWVSIERIEDDSRLSDFYNSGDLLILPSIEDNLPLTMLESIASGTPVVAFNIGGMKDIIKSGINGELAEEINSSSLSKAILKLIIKSTSLEKNALRDSCAYFADINFKNHIEASKYLELYRDIVQSKTKKIELKIQSKLKNFKEYFFLDYIIIITKISLLPLLSKVYKFLPENIKNIYRKFRTQIN